MMMKAILIVFVSCLLCYHTTQGLDVTEKAVKVCQPSDDGTAAPCLPMDSSLTKQTYNLSIAVNAEQLARPFNYTDQAVVTTGQINNVVTFGCQQKSNAVDDVEDTLAPQLSKTVEFVQKFSKSCKEVLDKHPSATSGNYTLLLSNGSVAEVYCDMVGVDCENLGGWTRLGYFNMAESGYDTCPSPLVARDYDGLDYPLCQRASYNSGCNSIYYDNFGIEYNSVCGRALGYQKASPDGFGWSWVSIDSTYVDGLSITYDNSPRKHIWSFAAGVTPDGTGASQCPCNSGSWFNHPSFVGNNYYCESGAVSGNGWAFTTYTGDKLWDGKQCDGKETTCCSDGQPWFSRLLTASTTSQIELRMCDDENENNERTPVEMFEIYVR